MRNLTSAELDTELEKGYVDYVRGNIISFDVDAWLR